MMWNISLR
jgi:ksgA: dimethyladenosine transferase